MHVNSLNKSHLNEILDARDSKKYNNFDFFQTQSCWSVRLKELHSYMQLASDSQVLGCISSFAPNNNTSLGAIVISIITDKCPAVHLYL